MNLAKRLLAAAMEDGGAPPDEPLYVEDVFEIVTWTGNGAARFIPTQNDLTDGTWVIMMRRIDSALPTYIYAPHVAADRYLDMSSDGVGTTASYITSLTATGFWLASTAGMNLNTAAFTAWLFKVTPKFFTRITYTGTSAARAIAHDLDCVPGMIWVKCTSSVSRNWCCYNRGVAVDAETDVYYGQVQTTPSDSNTFWNDTAPTSTQFHLGTAPDVNLSGETYDAYLFAHDTSPEGIIECGGKTYDTNGIIELGWEPQLVYTRRIDAAAPTYFTDVMNGFAQSIASLSTQSKGIQLNTAATNATIGIAPTTTGFNSTITSGQTVIFMAIRRGLMRTPTDATKVFDVNLRVGTGVQTHFAGPSWPADWWWVKNRSGGSGRTPISASRIRGNGVWGGSTIEDHRIPATTGSYGLSSSKAPWRVVAELGVGTPSATNESAVNMLDYFFRRAKGFLEVVTYAGVGGNATIPHKLGVIPDLVVVKRLDVASAQNSLVRGYPGYGFSIFSNAGATGNFWNSTDPTADVFSVGDNIATNAAGSQYIAFLMASVPGVCKIGTYVSDGLARDIAHGFASTPRMVLIKCITTTTASVALDTERGINAGASEPQGFFGSTTAESSSDVVDPGTGVITFKAGHSDANVSGRTYMYMMIA